MNGLSGIIEPMVSEGLRFAGDKVRCESCRHGAATGFLGLLPEEARFMNDFKTRRSYAAARTEIVATPRPFLLTLYSGWALRCRILPDGKRTAVGLALPGDLIGAETLIERQPDLVLRALTDATFCEFPEHRWRELLTVPSLAERFLTAQTNARRQAELAAWSAAHQDAAARICHFLADLHVQLRDRQLARGPDFAVPFGRSLLAEMLGLTPMHLRRVLALLEREQIVSVERGRVRVLDEVALRERASASPPVSDLRPLL